MVGFVLGQEGSYIDDPKHIGKFELNMKPFQCIEGGLHEGDFNEVEEVRSCG